MLKKLKRKFILVSMTAVFLVLLIIMGTINIINYVNTKQNADQLLNILEDNDGTFPTSAPEQMDGDNTSSGSTVSMPDKSDPAPNNGNSEISPTANETTPDMAPTNDNMTPPANDDNSKAPAKPQGDNPRHDGISPEAPFNTRYFTVTMTVSGDSAAVSETDVSNIAAITSDTAESYAETLYSKNRKEGYYGNYRYRQIALSDGSIMYIFLDCERDLNSFHSFFYASILISLAGLLLIFILLIIFSKNAVRPIVESYDKQKRFITDASHEIKTPLAIIDANTDVIEMESGESQWTSSTKKQIERLTFLTEKLVLLSKMDEEQPRIEMLSLDLSDLLTDVITSFDAVCASREKKMTTSIEPDIQIKGNADTLRQAFTLLIDNAIKYSNVHGSIHVSCRKKGHSAVLVFENSVEQITPGKHNELFERFYRPDSSRNTETGGFGIGLATVKAITEAHKGKASAKSEDEHSIEFVLTLPL
jgi:two-component system sensor histidine kinase CiaH